MRLNIRRKILLFVLAVSLMALGAAAAVTLHQVLKLRNNLIAIVGATNESMAGDLEAAAVRRVKAHVMDVVEGGRRFIDARLSRMRDHALIMSDLVTEIYSAPSRHAVYAISPPVAGNGELAGQVLYADSAVDVESLRTEVGKAAGIQDYLLSLLNRDPLINAGTVAAESGFSIDVDRISLLKFREDGTAFFEARSRPWYRAAKAKESFLFTEAFDDMYHATKVIVGTAPFHRNGEFAGVVALNVFLTDLQAMVRETKIGKSGFGVIVNAGGHIVIGQDDSGGDSGRPLLSRDDLQTGDGRLARTRIGGREVYLALAPLSAIDWRFAVIVDVDEIGESAEEVRRGIDRMSRDAADAIRAGASSVIKSALFELALLIAFTVFASRVVSNHFTRPLNTLMSAVTAVSSGNLDVRVDIGTGDEIEDLSRAFNGMAADLRGYMANLAKATAEKERIAAELDVARSIQIGMLPSIFPPFPERAEFDIFATMTAAREVGGDMYDFFLLGEDRVCLVAADICGKGIPAALFMVVVKTLLKNQAQLGLSPRDIAGSVNDKLCENNDSEMFATAFIGIYDVKTRTLEYVNAGHNYPLFAPGGDEWRFLEPSFNNPMLGALPGMEYRQEELEVPPGSTLLLYTDGVTEAFNREDKQYSEGRLKDFLNREMRFRPEPSTLVEAVERDVMAFVDGREQSDDMTLLAFRTSGEA